MATHDYVIDNSTGANVRTDLNNVLQAILTNNSSGSAPSTTASYMLWADTSNNILKMRNTAIASGTSSKAVTFQHPFFTGTSELGGSTSAYLPNIGITIENAQSGDFFALSSISGTGFTIDIKNGSSFVNRNFKYAATGFGRGS